jgi:hypothetical protein
MKPITITRRERLLQAIDARCDGSRTLFAEKMGWKTPGRVQRYITEKGSNRSVGFKMAREIERKLGLPENSMDVPLELATPRAPLKITAAPSPMADQLLALFNELSPDGQDLLLMRANRLYTEEHPDEVSQVSPFGGMSLRVANPSEVKKTR